MPAESLLKTADKHTLKEFRHFFETYKLLKGKPAPVEVGEVKGKDAAVAAFNESIALYTKKFAK